MMRQSITVLTTAFVIFGSFSAKAFALPGGGTEADPWRIESLANFNEFAGDSGYWGGHIRLETDISLIGTTYATAPIAGGWDVAFTGVFDGNGHTISDLTVDTAGVDNDCLGLFGGVGSPYVTAEVKNLGVVNVRTRKELTCAILASIGDGRVTLQPRKRYVPIIHKSAEDAFC